jgi:soluble lytic murein transglycosylase-like protein
MTRPLLIAACCLCLLFAVVCDWQTGKLAERNRQIDTLKRELAGQMFEVQRARAVAAEVDELRFLAGAMETNDRNLYAISRAAWKYQRPDVGPWLILAIAHRESNFDPMAVSYVNGQPCAYGVMQINAKAHNLNPYKLWDIDYNVQQGVRILSGYITQSGGDIGRALLRYYGGNPDVHGFGYSERVLGSKYFSISQ